MRPSTRRGPRQLGEALLADRLPRLVRALGIDLGTKRIGVAMSDAGGTLASPLEVVARSKQSHRDIAAIVDEWEVELVVVGMPLSLSGDAGPAARAAAREVEQLRDVLSVPVETYDERLTTVSADRLLQEAGVDSRNRRKVIDMVAAAVILQSWLDARHATQPTDSHE